MTVTKTLNRWEKSKQRTRQRLRESTLFLLLEQGFKKLTIQAVADHADLSRGTFYLHYDDLEDVIWQVVTEALDTATNDILTGFRDMDYKQRKYHIWKRIFEFADEHRLLLEQILGKNGHPYFVRQIETYFVTVIENSIEGGIFSPNIPSHIPTAFTAQFITGSLIRLIVWSFEQDYTPEVLGQYFYEVLYHEAMPDKYRA